MRWIYADPRNPRERGRKEEILGHIRRWWAAFIERRPDVERLFAGEANWDLSRWMLALLEPIHPDLTWEFGPGMPSGHHLVITAESSAHLRPLVKSILDRAPALPGWRFFPHRLQETVADTARDVEARTGRTLAGVRALAAPGMGGRVDITLLWPSPDFDEERCGACAILAAQSLLGEQLLYERVGAIDVAPLERPGVETLSLGDLPATVARLVADADGHLPDRPCWQLERSTYSMWELKPQPAEDHPGRSDIHVALSMCPDMWRTSMTGAPFRSANFSRCGETFCYVKVDGLEGSCHGDRGELEDAIDGALRKGRAGCAVGGGTGLRYLYVDLALVDVERGLQIVREVLRAAAVPARAWILFLDEDLGAEWVGIHDHSPVPPGFD